MGALAQAGVAGRRLHPAPTNPRTHLREEHNHVPLFRVNITRNLTREYTYYVSASDERAAYNAAYDELEQETNASQAQRIAELCFEEIESDYDAQELP